FKAKATGHLSHFFSVDSKYTVAEAYGKDASLMNVAVKFNSGVVATSEFGLYQNTPNPFKGATVIGFNLPEASFGTLTISDVSGKVLKVIKGDFNKGYNQVSVNSGEFSQAGVMYYQLETATHTATKKMIIIE